MVVGNVHGYWAGRVEHQPTVHLPPLPPESATAAQLAKVNEYWYCYSHNQLQGNTIEQALQCCHVYRYTW